MPHRAGVHRTRADVLVLGPDGFKTDTAAVKINGVRWNRCDYDCADVIADRFEIAFTTAQQVQITRGPIGLIRPHAQKHGALQQEAAA